MYIGIDLGTTNSAVAGFNNSEVKIYKTSEGSDTLPSVFYVNKSGHKLYGMRAYGQTLISPENGVSGFKRLMGTSTKFNLKASSLSLSVEECSSEILKQLIEQVCNESGSEEITGAVITIPAAFNQMQSEATIRSANLAGLEKVALLQEPVAAAMTAMSYSKNKNGQFLIYDLGGGTFDLALVQSISGAINIIAHEGVNMLGGRDFDRSIVNNFVRPWLIEKFDLPVDFQKHEKYSRLIRIAHIYSEMAKIELSKRDKEVIFADELGVKDEKGNDIYLEVALDRKDLEQVISTEVEKTIELSRKILRDNGYGYEDIDRIVFIGGPTKMPYIRNKVSNDLGIPLDLQVDPMIAVAQGAAIYCESREWKDGTTKRKKSRASQEVKGSVNIKYDYPSRSSDEKAKIRLQATDIDDGYEIQIDSNSGWTSGRIPINRVSSVDLHLNQKGENTFLATVFDEAGKPIKEAETKFVILRTFASSIGIPATQTIAVKVRESLNNSRNKLVNIIEKGCSLPTSGVQKFRVARDLIAGEKDEHLDFEVYQNENAPEPELNLCVGAFRLNGNDLEKGMKIREGDEINFHWEMSDSGLLNATVELPTLGQSFDTPKFYTDLAGHQSFDLESGTKLANNLLENAEKDLNNLKKAIGESGKEVYQKFEDELVDQRETLENACENDTTRAVTEKARQIRQQISILNYLPENRCKVLKQNTLKAVDIFNKFNRDYADLDVKERFDTHKNNALNCIINGEQKAIKEAEAHVKEMELINANEIWKNPDFLLVAYSIAVNDIYLATNKEKYSMLLEQGEECIETSNFHELRHVLYKLTKLKMNISGVDHSPNNIASIMAA